MKLPVYSRAHLSRTAALVVAPLLTAVSTSALACEFRAATPLRADPPRRHRISIAHNAVLIGKFASSMNVPAMTGIDANGRRDPATAQPIERIRKVE
jgi:hypothetical protein